MASRKWQMPLKRVSQESLGTGKHGQLLLEERRTKHKKQISQGTSQLQTVLLNIGTKH